MKEDIKKQLRNPDPPEFKIPDKYPPKKIEIMKKHKKIDQRKAKEAELPRGQYGEWEDHIQVFLQAI